MSQPTTFAPIITTPLPERITIPTRDAPRASLLVHVDPVEHGRRQAAGLGAVTDAAALDVMLELPVGMPVALIGMSSTPRHFVNRIPVGAATISGARVTRHAVRPLTVLMATVYGNCSETSLMYAERFTPFCTRRILTTIRPVMPDTLIEIGFYGIGVTYQAPDGTEETLVEAKPWVPKRHTPTGWRFVELAYKTVLEQYVDPAV